MEQKFIDEMCRCPYCFKKFSPEAVQFKAMTMYTEQDLEDFSDSERGYPVQKILESVSRF